jgi:hypothetical protein
MRSSGTDQTDAIRKVAAFKKIASLSSDSLFGSASTALRCFAGPQPQRVAQFHTVALVTCVEKIPSALTRIGIVGMQINARNRPSRARCSRARAPCQNSAIETGEQRMKSLDSPNSIQRARIPWSRSRKTSSGMSESIRTVICYRALSTTQSTHMRRGIADLPVILPQPHHGLHSLIARFEGTEIAFPHRVAHELRNCAPQSVGPSMQCLPEIIIEI